MYVENFKKFKTTRQNKIYELRAFGFWRRLISTTNTYKKFLFPSHNFRGKPCLLKGIWSADILKFCFYLQTHFEINWYKQEIKNAR